MEGEVALGEVMDRVFVVDDVVGRSESTSWTSASPVMMKSVAAPDSGG